MTDDGAEYGLDGLDPLPVGGDEVRPSSDFHWLRKFRENSERTVVRYCRICGTQYAGKTNKHYCSDRCRKRDYARRTRAQVRAERIDAAMD